MELLRVTNQTLTGLNLTQVQFLGTDSGTLVSMSTDKLIKWTSPLAMLPKLSQAQGGFSAPVGGARSKMAGNSNASLSLNELEFVRTRHADFNAMTLSVSGDKVVAATVDNMITVWNTADAVVLAVLPGHTE